MADYSNWLLVSDIDGTLNGKNLKLPENNRMAIKEYVNKGGYFTLCSGRNLQSLTSHYKKLDIKTPAIFLNGAGIYDFTTEKMLNYTPLSSEGEDIILDVFKKEKFVSLSIFEPSMIYNATYKSLYGYTASIMNNLDIKTCKTLNDLPRGEWGKAVFCSSTKKIKKLKAFFENEENSKIFDCCLSSRFTLELLHNGVNKGSAVKKLAGVLNVDTKNTAAIGDYYNDVDMLKSVSHPVCCGQAPDDIKAISEYVACHCNEGAVADFINYIVSNYIEKSEV